MEAPIGDPAADPADPPALPTPSPSVPAAAAAAARKGKKVPVSRRPTFVAPRTAAGEVEALAVAKPASKAPRGGGAGGKRPPRNPPARRAKKTKAVVAAAPSPTPAAAVTPAPSPTPAAAAVAQIDAELQSPAATVPGAPNVFDEMHESVDCETFLDAMDVRSNTASQEYPFDQDMAPQEYETPNGEEGFLDENGFVDTTIGRSGNYQADEDKVLCLAWKKIVLDAAVGTEQPRNTYWIRMAEERKLAKAKEMEERAMAEERRIAAEERRAAAEERAAAAEELKAATEARKVAMEERKMAMEESHKEIEQEQKLMFMDMSQLDDKQKAYIELCRDATLAKKGMVMRNMYAMSGFMGGMGAMSSIGGASGFMGAMGGIGGMGGMGGFMGAMGGNVGMGGDSNANGGMSGGGLGDMGGNVAMAGASNGSDAMAGGLSGAMGGGTAATEGMEATHGDGNGDNAI